MKKEKALMKSVRPSQDAGGLAVSNLCRDCDNFEFDLVHNIAMQGYYTHPFVPRHQPWCAAARHKGEPCNCFLIPVGVPDPTPIRPVVERDEKKIEIVRAVLARLEAGEQFQGLAILLADNHQYEAPYDGKFFELLTAGVRFVHRMNREMDERIE